MNHYVASERIPMPEIHPAPKLGSKVEAPFYIGDSRRLKSGIVKYINYLHHWFLVDFGRGLRECYHFGEV